MAMNRYLLAGLWLLITTLVAGYSLHHWKAGPRLEADLFTLLPRHEQDPLVQRAQQAAESMLSRTTLLWVSAAPSEPLTESVNRVTTALKASDQFATILSGTPAPSAEHFSALLPWRFNLLSPMLSEQLRAADGTQKFLNAYFERLASPFAAGPVSLQQDALGLLNQWLPTLPVNTPQVDPATGLWLGMIDGRQGAFLILFNKADAFTLEAPKQIAATIDNIRTQESARGGRVIASGAALFAAVAAQQAKSEISTVGVGSVVTALVLIVWVFRSFRAWLSLLPVAYGSWIALMVCELVFDRVHLMTLVFGSSLTGVSIDYALHVMTDAFQTRGQWSASNAVRKLLPGLTLGMLTSVLAYACLALAPFPGLQQVALFSGVSLFSAYVMVIMLFPLLLSGFQRKHTPILLTLIQHTLEWRNHILPYRKILLMIFALITAGGFLQLHPKDDIRQLYGTTPQLAQEDAAIRKAFGINHNSQFLLIEATDEQALLAKEKQVTLALAPLIEANKLARYSALSQWLPDTATQSEYQTLLAQRIFSPESPARQTLIDMGISAQVVDKEWQDFQAVHGQTLNIENALKIPLAAPWKSLWLGTTPNGVASRISLQGATDMNAIASAISKFEGVRLVDRVASISQLLGDYRVYTTALIALALVGVWGFLTPRYGARDALQVVVAPAVAIFLTVSLHGWFDLTFNLFSLFGFLIVLGMGVDYAIYFHEAKDHLDNTALGIALDALTTLISFGLLAVSATPAVSAFGTSVLLGITLSWLFAYLVKESLVKESRATQSPTPQEGVS